MIVKTIFSGFGGQGVLMMGYSFAHGAMSEGYEVTYLPAYGAEVRGGTANCTVAVGDEEIASPIASEPDYLVVLNTPSLYTFQNRIAAGGLLFLNSSIISARPSRQDMEVFAIPASDIAEELGNARAFNTVMMGAFLKRTSLVKPEIYLKSLETVMGSKKKAVVEINRKAFSAGYDFLKA
ncbi:MAG TPA: 2-oxoacid:ferredoxin oxidoreductase subunit gamma [Syntrophus sp. (in: bacteria)]|jgi:2-oxoglutarate ferredoxin oxidoreductase subunit gamma|nr:2-oxoacid:ferredoxin oxidoreductase subunit gamma [Syntrophus sp. (in: bacteria)]